MLATTKNQLQDTNNDYVYDSAGNLTQPGPIGGPYVYDAENHLLSAGGVTYTYDGDGNRVMKSNGTIYWYGANSASLEETDLNGNLQRWYYFFNGQRIARGLTTNEVGFYMTDHLGNVRYLGGSATGYALDYYPFGADRIVNNDETGDDRYQFTGKERDSESGLDNFGARYNSSAMGRFMSPDSIGGRPAFPQSWNLYAYVANNPLNAVDPTGLDCIYINNDTGKYEGFNSGDCDNSTEAKANTGNYVDGTVNTIYTTTGTDQGVVTGYSGTNNDSGTPTLLSGTFNSSAPPTNSDALNPFAQGVFSQLNQMNILNNTLKIYGASAVIGITGGAACYYLCPAATITTLGATVGGTLGPAAADPRLQNFINMLFQATDQMPGGTAGAVRSEIRTGELLSQAGHSIKAQEVINGLQKLVNSGTLSQADTATAKGLIEDLRSALSTSPWMR